MNPHQALQKSFRASMSVDNRFQYLVLVAPKAALVPRRVSNSVGRVRIAGRRQSRSSASATAIMAASQADGAACHEENEERGKGHPEAGAGLGRSINVVQL